MCAGCGLCSSKACKVLGAVSELFINAVHFVKGGMQCTVYMKGPVCMQCTLCKQCMQCTVAKQCVQCNVCRQCILFEQGMQSSGFSQ